MFLLSPSGSGATASRGPASIKAIEGLGIFGATGVVVTEMERVQRSTSMSSMKGSV